MALPKARGDLEYKKFIETAGGEVAVRTTATISGDVNVDSISVGADGLIGKSSGGDFGTAYASSTTITCSSLPSYHSTLLADDIVTVIQINSSGSVVETYTRDDAAMSVAGNVVTVSGASFAAGDSFVIYTNVGRRIEVEITKDDDSVTIFGSDDGGTHKRLIKTDSGGAVQVDVESSALPSGAATESSLSSLDGKVTACDTGSVDIDDISKGTQSNDVKITLDSEVVEVKSEDSLTNSFTQLTAVGSTSGFAVSKIGNHSLQYVVASIDTNVVVRAEGSLDNSSWFNLDVNNLDTTITANGTYLMSWKGSLSHIRFTIVSESGGTSVTVDVKYRGDY